MDAPPAPGSLAARPRRLRLSEMLEELRAEFPSVATPDADRNAPPDTADAAADTADVEDGLPANDPPSDGASTSAATAGDRAAVAAVAAQLDARTLTIGTLIDKGGDAGFGFLIAMLVLIAIPFFGLSTPFGIAIATVGSQMVMGKPRPWLPRRARRRALSSRMMERVTTMLARRTRWLVRATRRRWEAAIQPRVIGVGVVILALGLALPLPIPGSNWVFLFPLFVYAIGILERDGAWIVVGHLLTLVDIALLVVFWRVVWIVLVGVWRWFT